MKKIILLGITAAMLFVSLWGCFVPYYHDDYYGGHHRRDRDRYERYDRYDYRR
jgi:hypothetical protein